MNNANQGAFPDHRRATANEYAAFSNGLTKREYFAGLAMQSLIEPSSITQFTSDSQIQELTKVAVKIADFILAEFEK
jgi:hypothetical protein